MKTKQVIVPVPLALHTRFKYRAHAEGLSMSRVVRALMKGWLEGRFDVEELIGEDRIPRAGRPAGNSEGADNDGFYDSLYEKVAQAVES